MVSSCGRSSPVASHNEIMAETVVLYYNKP